MHDNECYTCNMENHTHSGYDGSCYNFACEELTHAHTDSCYVNFDRLDSSLWTFVKSDTVTVAADGSSVVNVYYDRVEYSVKFYEDSDLSNEYESYRITAKWGANILNEWPQHNGSYSWYVPNKYDTWQNSIQIMPVGGAKFWGPVTGDGNYKAYYYVEALPGDVDTFKYNSVTYDVSYDEKGRVFTITNTAELEATGQLNWPIPVLAVAGVLLVATGASLLRKGRKNA